MYVVMNDEKSSFISHGPWYKNAGNCFFSDMTCFAAFGYKLSCDLKSLSRDVIMHVLSPAVFIA